MSERVYGSVLLSKLWFVWLYSSSFFFVVVHYTFIYTSGPIFILVCVYLNIHGNGHFVHSVTVAATAVAFDAVDAVSATAAASAVFFFFATQLLIDKILYEIQNRTNKKAYRNQSFRKRQEKKPQIKINGFQHLLTACIRSMMPQRDCVIVRLLAILCFRYYWISRSFCHYNFWNCVIHVGGTKLLFLVFFRLKTKSNNNNNNHTENAYDINIIIAWSELMKVSPWSTWKARMWKWQI